VPSALRQRPGRAGRPARRAQRRHTRVVRRLRWLLHDIDPKLDPPSRSLANLHNVERLARRLRTLPQTTQVRVCRENVAQIRDLVRRSDQIKRELAILVRRHTPALLELPGCGPLTAARIVGDIGDIGRFATDARLASYCGISPLDASSGRQQRHRLNRHGNRKLNRALHIIAVTQARTHATAQAYLARRLAEGKTMREALRAFKRHLIRIIYRILINTTNKPTHAPIAGARPHACLT
jgi:transposase